jgi:WhiB family redox-sensing transcriptional regulator
MADFEGGSTLGEDEQETVWQDFANCLGVDPDLFFPERGASTREAKEVCKGCVVREECLEYALSIGEKFGIWGGLSERERRRIRRQRALGRRAALEAEASSTLEDTE